MRHHEPDVGASQQTTSETDHTEVLRGLAGGFTGAHPQCPDLEPARSSREASSTHDRDDFASRSQADAPGVEESEVPTGDARAKLPLCAVTELEGAGVLDEKIPALGGKKWESGQIDLELVHLNVGKVGPVRNVQGDIGSDSEFEIPSGVYLIPNATDAA